MCAIVHAFQRAGKLGRTNSKAPIFSVPSGTNWFIFCDKFDHRWFVAKPLPSSAECGDHCSLCHCAADCDTLQCQRNTSRFETIHCCWPDCLRWLRIRQRRCDAAVMNAHTFTPTHKRNENSFAHIIRTAPAVNFNYFLQSREIERWARLAGGGCGNGGRFSLARVSNKWEMTQHCMEHRTE